MLRAFNLAALARRSPLLGDLTRQLLQPIAGFASSAGEKRAGKVRQRRGGGGGCLLPLDVKL